MMSFMDFFKIFTSLCARARRPRASAQSACSMGQFKKRLPLIMQVKAFSRAIPVAELAASWESLLHTDSTVAPLSEEQWDAVIDFSQKF
jgi:hypothetical protein